MRRDHFKLHLVVLLAGFTAVLGELNLNPAFYAGAALVIAAVAVHPFVGRVDPAPAGGGGPVA